MNLAFLITNMPAEQKLYVNFLPPENKVQQKNPLKRCRECIFRDNTLEDGRNRKCLSPENRNLDGTLISEVPLHFNRSCIFQNNRSSFSGFSPAPNGQRIRHRLLGLAR